MTKSFMREFFRSSLRKIISWAFPFPKTVCVDAGERDEMGRRDVCTRIAAAVLSIVAIARNPHVMPPMPEAMFADTILAIV